MEEMREKTISSEEKYSGNIIRVKVDRVELPGGKESKREVVEHPGAVGIVAEHKGKIVLVKQYRYPTGEAIWEIPAGKLEEGEPPEECARRELTEETGYSPAEIRYLNHFFSSPGFSDEVIYLYYASGLVEQGSSAGKGDGEENIEMMLLDWKEARDLVLHDKINDAKTVIGVLTLAHLYDVT